jgi:hypothetical protein
LTFGNEIVKENNFKGGLKSHDEEADENRYGGLIYQGLEQ